MDLLFSNIEDNYSNFFLVSLIYLMPIFFKGIFKQTSGDIKADVKQLQT